MMTGKRKAEEEDGEDVEARREARRGDAEPLGPILTTEEAKRRFTTVFRKTYRDATAMEAKAAERKHAANAMARLYEVWDAADQKPDKEAPVVRDEDRVALRRLAWALAGVPERCPKCQCDLGWGR